MHLEGNLQSNFSAYLFRYLHTFLSEKKMYGCIVGTPLVLTRAQITGVYHRSPLMTRDSSKGYQQRTRATFNWPGSLVFSYGSDPLHLA
jgi:hypothetical protein